MERINLLPEDMVFTGPSRLLYLAERRFWPTLASGTVAAVALVVLLSVFQGVLSRYYSARIQAAEAQQLKVERELQRMEGVSLKLQEREKQLVQQIGWNEHRARYLEAYKSKSTTWGTTFQEIKRLIPYGVWLTELETNPGGRVRLAGGAFEEDLITRFMGELKENPAFSEVGFNFLKKDKVGKTVFVRFEILSQLAVPMIDPGEEFQAGGKPFEEETEETG